MPLGKNVRYAMKKTPKGMMRLAFKNGKVIEAKNMKTGRTHTPAEFRADARRRKGGKKSKARKR
jgi:hypothetical protein